MSIEAKKVITPGRVMCFFGMLVLIVASVMSYNHTPAHLSIIPKPESTIFAINTLSAFLAFMLVIFPENWMAACLLMFLQSITTTLTGYDTLGTFLYAGFVILLFVNGFFKSMLKTKITVLILIWILVLSGYGYYALNNTDFGSRGIYRLALEISVSIFFFGFYYYVYKKLEALLVTLVPAKPVQISNLNLPVPGSDLHLADFNLSERQIKLVLEYLSSEKSYSELGEQFFISTSTVKKDMTEVFNKFGVSNIKDLHILLLQYIVKA